MLYMGQVLATPVQIEYEGLRLNGNLVEPAAHLSGPVFVIVHGTWGHAGMEIIEGLQARLADDGQASLAITLSLGVDDRRGFLHCELPIKANHGAAADEINQWVKYAQSRWEQIVLVGHSRGGNQVMLYEQVYRHVAKQAVVRLVLIAPMTWNADEAAKAYEDKYGVVLRERLETAQAQPDEPIHADLLNCPGVDVLGKNFLSYYSAEPNRNTATLLATAARPVLVFEGTEDSLAQGFVVQEALVAGSPQVTVQWIEGAGHFFRDLYSDDLVESMLEWLNL
jgi:pimeloyl-ACP methyl ester carboxylesterase